MIVPILKMRKMRLRQVQMSQAGIQSQERLAAIPSDKNSQEYAIQQQGNNTEEKQRVTCTREKCEPPARA